MDRNRSTTAGHAVAESAFRTSAAALAATLMLLFTPTVWADELICEVPQDGHPLRYLIDVDDRRNTVTVVNANTNQNDPITVGEMTPERVLPTSNGMRMDATKHRWPVRTSS